MTSPPAPTPDFDLTNPYCSHSPYNSLTDRHLKHFHAKPTIRKLLISRGILLEDSSSKERSQVDERLQKVKIFVKERTKAEELNRKRLRQQLRQDAATRERIKSELTNRKEMQQARREREIRKRSATRAIEQMKERIVRRTKTEKLISRGEKREKELNERRKNVLEERKQKAEERMKRLMTSMEQRRDEDAKQRRTEEEMQKIRSAQRQQLYALLHEKQRRVGQQRRKTNRLVSQEKYEQSQALLNKSRRRKVSHLDAFREDIAITYGKFQSSPIAIKQVISANQYAERYREACGLPSPQFALPTLYSANQRPTTRAAPKSSERKVVFTDKAIIKGTTRKRDIDNEDDVTKLARDIVHEAITAGARQFVKSWL